MNEQYISELLQENRELRTQLTELGKIHATSSQRASSALRISRDCIEAQDERITELNETVRLLVTTIEAVCDPSIIPTEVRQQHETQPIEQPARLSLVKEND